MKHLYKIGLLAVLILILIFTLRAFLVPKDTGTPTVTPAPETENVSEECYGSPWINSMVTGNLPETVPAAKDDLYLHCNYEDFKAHQGELYGLIISSETYAADEAGRILASGTLSASDQSYSESELTQLKIFFDQASDIETLHQSGLSELQPYLDRIDNITTIKEMNALLVSDDFPFSPYIYMTVSAYDMSDVNNVFIFPELLFVDDVEGPIYYQESDDEVIHNANRMMIDQKANELVLDLPQIFPSEQDSKPLVSQILQFEESYAKSASAGFIYQDKEYGALNEDTYNLSLEELAALAPNYPVKETLQKFGKDSSPFYTVMAKKWLETFNAMWTQENLETIKRMTKIKLVDECLPYLDPEFTSASRAYNGLAKLDENTNGINACDQNNTFAQLVARIYAEDVCPDNAVPRLKQLTQDLIASYQKRIEKTSWLNDTTRAKILEKLEKMHLNILMPEGGYTSYSKLSLTPTEKGGTLFSNYLKLKAYNNGQINARIGKDAQARLVWEHFQPTTFNCFYDPDTNSINIMPGFITESTYQKDMTDEELFGGLGTVIGHEISHAFDYIGSQRDAEGTAHCTFEEDDLEEYLAIVDQVTAYYDTMEPYPDIYVNGTNVKSEAIADIIGTQIMLDAAEAKNFASLEPVFQTNARFYSIVLPDSDYLFLLMGADGHPLSYLRTNVSAQMCEQLYKTYDIKEGDGMYLPKEKRIVFWGE